MWLDEPSDLHSTSWMPASSRMARAAPPAMTPVPGAAGFSMHASGAGLSDDRVGDGAAGEGHGEEVLLGFLGALLDGEGHLLGLAVAEADTAVAVADDDQRGEGEAAPALHDLGHSVDGDDPRLPQATRGGVEARHGLQLQSGCTGGVGHSRDPAVVEEATPVEHDLGDAGGLGPLGHQLADLGRGGDVAGRACTADVGLERWRQPPACDRWCRRSPARPCAGWIGTRPDGAARRCR